MNRFFRRALIGCIAGAIASTVLVTTLDNIPLAVALGILAGIGSALAFHAESSAYLDSVMTLAALGAPLWAVVHIILLPLLAAQVPQWTPDGMRAQFPALVGWILYGALLGFFIPLLNDLVRRFIGNEMIPVPPPREIKTRIVILGGGFAGVTTAQHLEKEFGPDPSVEITLISDTNALLFTPMLAEVAGGSLEPTHISTPLRSSVKRTNVVRGSVGQIDLKRHCVELVPDRDTPDAKPRVFLYDQLVIALGSKASFMGMQGVQEYALNFKSLIDAMHIRNRVIDCIERVEHEQDELKRRSFLTFVVAGGGFAGAELAGALNDFARGILLDYPNIAQADVKIMLVHSRALILPELSDGLARYAMQKMAQRGVTFLMNVRVVDAARGMVRLTDGTEIATQTLVWTAGTAPHPLLQALPVERDARGAIVVDSTMGVKGFDGVWALGDCANIPDAVTRESCPPTAQYALREAKTLAHNIYARVHGKPLEAFAFKPLGISCVVGHQTACVELNLPIVNRPLRFSGLAAWLGWRAIYLWKLPGLERQVRVMSDWLIELFFPRDIVQTIEFE